MTVLKHGRVCNNEAKHMTWTAICISLSLSLYTCVLDMADLSVGAYYMMVENRNRRGLKLCGVDCAQT
eukprot:464076-Amphidinium_carterae.1